MDQVKETSRVLTQLSRTAETWNGAVSYATTGFEKLASCLDYFSKAGSYVHRPQEQVDVDMARIFADDSEVALRIVFGLRLITRKPNVAGIEEEVQTGYGKRDEFYKAIAWLHFNQPDLLYRNLHLIPVFGCWRDFVTEPLINILDRDKVYSLFQANLDDQLLRKYLPQIRSKTRTRGWSRNKSGERFHRDPKKLTDRAACRSLWAKGFAKFLGISDRDHDYRLLKSQGAAHIWQKQMGRNEWSSINFNGIPGRAMTHHVSRKGRDKLTVFERHGLVEKLKTWALSQQNIKFTGYPYELTRAVGHNPNLIQKIIFNKQFEKLLEPMRSHNLGNVLACLDTSGSMSSILLSGVTAYDICISMGLVFSALNVGYFQNAVCAFDDRSKLVKLDGEFCDRLKYIQTMTVAWGSTNFQSVINLLVDIRKRCPDIPVDEYPETLLVISDMQFNPVGRNLETNYEAAQRKLSSVGLNDVRIIWWQVNGAQTTDFPSQMHDKGCYMISGFDPVNIKALMGLEVNKVDKKDFVASEKKEQSPLDGMLNFLSQPIFGLVETG